MTQNNSRPMARPKRRSKMELDNSAKILLAGFAIVGILLAIVGGKFVFNLVKGWSVTSLSGAPIGTSNTSNPANTPGNALQTNTAPSAASWDGKSRINILLLGLDYSDERAAKEGAPSRSDTMILVTIDPVSKTLGALSIRRDLWVNIPGHDYNKINSAHFFGQIDNIPGVGGPGLAMQTVEEFLGVPIDFYARVDFNTFVKLVDEIGGVPINVQEPMLMDPYHTGMPFWQPAGWATMPGAYALEYARHRDDASGGDVGRGSRQMEVIQAIFKRIMDWNLMPKLIARAPALYAELSSGVQTNLTLGQAIQLGLLMTKIPQENFKTYNITYDYCSPEMVWTSTGETYILRPFMDKIRILRDEIFVNGTTAAAPAALATESGQPATGDPLSLAKAENARIEVLNGSSAGGLADKTASYLTSQGLNVIATGNASEGYTYTTIVLHNATPYTLSYLAQLMGNIPNNRIYNRYEPNGNVDITVYLGSDWANSNPMPN